MVKFERFLKQAKLPQTPEKLNKRKYIVGHKEEKNND